MYNNAHFIQKLRYLGGQGNCVGRRKPFTPLQIWGLIGLNLVGEVSTASRMNEKRFARG